MYMRTTILTITALILNLSGNNCMAQSTWANAIAKLSLSEYLDLFFASNIKPQTAFQKVESYFVPNSSAKEAVLYLVIPVVVPVDDLPTRANLENSLKKKTQLFASHIKRLLGKSSIKKRWKGANVKDNLVIHFVDSHKRSSTIGLFENGTVAFHKDVNQESLKKIKRRVGDSFAK